MSIPVCTASSRRRVTCVIGSTTIDLVFINRRVRCSGIVTIHHDIRYLGAVIIFSTSISLHKRGGMCAFSRFVTLNGGSSVHGRIGHHVSTTHRSSLTVVVCASNAANGSGNIVLLRSSLVRTVHVRSVHLAGVGHGSASVTFLPVSRIFRHT